MLKYSVRQEVAPLSFMRMFCKKGYIEKRKWVDTASTIQIIFSINAISEGNTHGAF